ncbi:MAG: NAD-dependent epimerase/dehydratase family protein [Gammaproteobacteria bacterium]|nr:NAD-dependent epimerase/dehydratase family protein [Gammaproteobacteria bacterium]MBU1483040.1 NAD-dependent epimerase/dehydratase family protein [Gammaproteobacteria bacterium]
MSGNGDPQRFLVLGGRGFIGSHLVDALLTRGHYVRCFDRPHVSPLAADHLSNPNFLLHEGDFTSEADIEAALEGCDICFHLVSTTLPNSSNIDPVFDVESNLKGSVRLLTHAVRAGVKKIIFISSGGTVYGIPQEIPIKETHPTNPICSYGITKLATEKYLGLFRELHGIECVVLRLANPFGERQRIQASQGAVAVFLGKVLRGEAIEIWGDGSVVRDYIYVADVVDAMMRSITYSGEEYVFNIGSGRGISLNQVLDSIENTTGCAARRRYLPGRSFDVPASVLNIDRAARLLNWTPKTDFDQGLDKFALWLRKQLEHSGV